MLKRDGPIILAGTIATLVTLPIVGLVSLFYAVSFDRAFDLILSTASVP
jgi:hypothetical protein